LNFQVKGSARLKQGHDEPGRLHEYYALGEDIGLAPILYFLLRDIRPLYFFLCIICIIQFFEYLFI